MVACCDVLEHVGDLAKVISEGARLLKAGGVFLHDTVNRTWLTKIVLIKIWQDWRIIPFSQPDVHVGEKFIKPTELNALMRSGHLVKQEMKGISPRKRTPFAMLETLRAIAGGSIRNEELTDRLGLCETEDPTTSYMGFALNSSAEPS
jgi:2-polyprenyl-6-hydroxyphenyl methylase / 3-demethylubiquinone-9 3-methyltransferase